MTPRRIERGIFVVQTPQVPIRRERSFFAMADSRDVVQLGREHAIDIWMAGLKAVQADTLVQQWVRVTQDRLEFGNPTELTLDLGSVRKIVVVGAGKAGAGMVAGLEKAIPEEVAQSKQLTGWVNVPKDCVHTTRWIHLHGARPAGCNEPTPEAVYGTERILDLVQELEPSDLCICLLSGGGSALLPAPVAGITLEAKQAVTRFLSAAGANINELNTVRKQLSRIKGGGLLRYCRAGWLVSLIISDVLGDPLDIIASGPTVPDTSTPQDALEILSKYGAREAGLPKEIFRVLEKKAANRGERVEPQSQIFNLLIGNNRTAVDAAAARARELGYQVEADSAVEPEGPAEEVGRELARAALEMVASPGPRCRISGGEPVVRLAPPDVRGLGGRNQQLVLAAAEFLWERMPPEVIILSAGTDGEDGPTDAAGAFVDRAVIEQAKERGFSPSDFLSRNDAYHFFEPLGALLRTGPTHTNVCDVRVVLTHPCQSPQRVH
jgi:glycerate 2-kinase